MRLITSVFLITLTTLTSLAEIKLPSVISDNMVLKQDANARIWGKADPGEIITISPSWTDKTYSVMTPADGNWSTFVPTPSALKTEQQMVFKSDRDTVTVNNILIGEVWLCSGQSNMLFPLGPENGKWKWKVGVDDLEEQLKDADYPEIRLFTVGYQESPGKELDDCAGQWEVCTPESAWKFSAVGFLFGRELHNEIKMPVGLIMAARGDTHAESWLKERLMKDNRFYDDVYEQFGLDKVSTSKKPYKVPATLWNGMIAPILGYTVSGNIWYQGEANDMRAEKYQTVFTTLIDSWRKEWGMPDMPFYFVQIAPFHRQSPAIREAQLNTFTSGIKNIGMAVITDGGDSLDIHPRNKKLPAHRLALWALNKQYGKNVAFSGPVFKSAEIEGNKITVSFDYAENGLKTSDGSPVTGFHVAGTDKIFYPATAVIDDDKVIVTSHDVDNPAAVRYGYDCFFRVNLINNDGLPASPFRSDDWNVPTKH